MKNDPSKFEMRVDIGGFSIPLWTTTLTRNKTLLFAYNQHIKHIEGFSFGGLNQVQVQILFKIRQFILCK